MKAQNKNGFTLIETLVALAIFVIGFLGIHKTVFSVVKNDVQLKNEKTINEVISNYTETLTYAETQSMTINNEQIFLISHNGKDISLRITRVDSTIPNVNTVEVLAELNEMGRQVSVYGEYSVSSANN